MKDNLYKKFSCEANSQKKAEYNPLFLNTQRTHNEGFLKKNSKCQNNVDGN